VDFRAGVDALSTGKYLRAFWTTQPRNEKQYGSDRLAVGMVRFFQVRLRKKNFMKEVMHWNNLVEVRAK
jgi:hypothetical protein